MNFFIRCSCCAARCFWACVCVHVKLLTSLLTCDSCIGPDTPPCFRLHLRFVLPHSRYLIRARCRFLTDQCFTPQSVVIRLAGPARFGPLRPGLDPAEGYSLWCWRLGRTDVAIPNLSLGNSGSAPISPAAASGGKTGTEWKMS